MNSLFLRFVWLVLLQCTLFYGCKSRQVSLVEARHAEQSFTARQLSIKDTLLYYPLPYHASGDAPVYNAAQFSHIPTNVEPMKTSIQPFNHSMPYIIVRHAAVQDSMLSQVTTVDTNRVIQYKSAPIKAFDGRQEKGFLSYLKDACAILFLLGFLALIVKFLLFNQKS